MIATTSAPSLRADSAATSSDALAYARRDPHHVARADAGVEIVADLDAAAAGYDQVALVDRIEAMPRGGDADLDAGARDRQRLVARVVGDFADKTALVGDEFHRVAGGFDLCAHNLAS